MSADKPRVAMDLLEAHGLLPETAEGCAEFYAELMTRVRPTAARLDPGESVRDWMRERGDKIPGNSLSTAFGSSLYMHGGISEGIRRGCRILGIWLAVGPDGWRVLDQPPRSVTP